MWTKEKIEELLQNNDRAVERALQVLLLRQTQDERVAEATKHLNNRGFMSMDAPRMTSMAKAVNKGYPLSQRQLLWLRRKDRLGRSRIGKYHRQLIEEANEKQKAKEAA